MMANTMKTVLTFLKTHSDVLYLSNQHPKTWKYSIYNWIEQRKPAHPHNWEWKCLFEKWIDLSKSLSIWLSVRWLIVAAPYENVTQVFINWNYPLRICKQT